MIKKGNLFEDGFTSKCHKHGLIVNKQILLGPLVFLQHPFVSFVFETSWIYKIKYMQPCITLTHVLQTCWEGSQSSLEIPHNDLGQKKLWISISCVFLNRTWYKPFPTKTQHKYQDFPTQWKIGRLDVICVKCENRPFVKWDLFQTPPYDSPAVKVSSSQMELLGGVKRPPWSNGILCWLIRDLLISDI